MMFFVIISKQEKTFNEEHKEYIKKRHFPQRAIEHFCLFTAAGMSPGAFGLLDM
jgi:hypothetical protein